MPMCSNESTSPSWSTFISVTNADEMAAAIKDDGGSAQGAIDPQQLLKTHDAVALTGGAEAARDLPIPGRDFDGIHYDNQFIFDEVAWNFEPSELGAAYGLLVAICTARS